MSGGRSRSRYIPYTYIPGQYPAESAGPLGRHDRADPSVSTPAGDTPGPTGTKGDGAHRLAEGGGQAQAVELPPDIRVYIWTGTPVLDLGHASLEVSGGLPKGKRYLSWWADGATEIAGGRLMGRTLGMDAETYGGSPTRVYSFPGLDATAIKAWLATQSQSYNLVTRNCATMVAEALREGGAPPPPLPVPVWDPGQAWQYCQWLKDNVPRLSRSHRPGPTRRR
jgi:hypothetical protein